MSLLLITGAFGCSVATPVYVEDTPKTEAPAAGEAVDGEEGAVQVAQAGQESGEQKQMVCYYVRPIGSNLPKKVCDVKTSVEERRQRDLREIERLRLQRGNTPN